MEREIYIFKMDQYSGDFLNREFLMVKIIYSFSKTDLITEDKFKIILSMDKDSFAHSKLNI